MENDKEPENHSSDSLQPAFERLHDLPNKTNTLSEHLNKLHSNPLSENGLFDTASKMQEHFAATKTIQDLLPIIERLHTAPSAVERLFYPATAIDALSPLLANQKIAESFLHRNELISQSKLIRSAFSIRDMFDSLEKNRRDSPLQGLLAKNSLSDLTAHSNLIRAVTFSSFAEKSLSNFPWHNLGHLINVTTSARKRISSNFVNLSTDYFNLFKSFDTNPLSFAELPPILTKAASVEYYTGANLLEVISSDESKDDTEEEALKNEIVYENEYSLNEYLPKIDPGLLTMWKGAVEAFNSTNIDKVRHFMVSLRELFMHVMHMLAPDENIFNWTQKPDFFDKGKPTRKARISYIYRNVSNDPFNKFVEKDIEATLLFIGMFQQGTHGINNPFSPNQLLAMKCRAEASLKFLLEIHFTTNL